MLRHDPTIPIELNLGTNGFDDSLGEPVYPGTQDRADLSDLRIDITGHSRKC